MAKIQKIFILFLCLGGLVACDDEEKDTPLPYVSVNVSFALSYAPYNTELAIPPGAIKIKEGAEGYNRNGLILVRLSDKDFRAYDATCTRNISQEASSLKVSADKFTAVCPVCGSTYYILQPGAFEKEGKSRLQEYRVNYNATTQSGNIFN